MTYLPRLLTLILLIQVAHARNVVAAEYPSLGFELALNVPRITAASGAVQTSEGSVPFALQVQGPASNALSCAGSSTVDGTAVSCQGKQTGKAYALTVLSADGGTRLTLKGVAGKAVATATYRGPKGRVATRRIPVALGVQGPPVTSRVRLQPATNAASKLTGTGVIESGYAGASAPSALRGSVKRAVVKWSLTTNHGRLTFSGREKDNAWSGRVTGKIGPAVVARRVSIPLTGSNPSTGSARFRGTVSTSDGRTQASKASGVRVTVQSDLNRNGAIDAGESVGGVTNGDGAYELLFPVVEGRPVMVEFALDGYSKTPKMFANVAAGAEVPVNTTLSALESLTRSGNEAKSADGRLELAQLPQNVRSLSGKVFNPVTETQQFPGEFADNQGNLLISSVFAAIEARDADGKPVTELGAGTRLRMQVPRDTWTTLRDLAPGNNRIDVPLYYYDEATGEWKRSSSDGWLEDEAGTVLAESTLAAIKSFSRTGNLFAAGTITHLSYWNIDWPVETHGCVAGRIVDATGQVVAGAVVSAAGTTYSGRSAGVTADSAGRFCVDVMRSERPGEDIDSDGIPGETNKISLSVYANGKYYDLGEVTVPPTPATCSLGGCFELGDVVLDAQKAVNLAICTIKGQTVYSGTAEGGNPGLQAGTPVGGSFVFAYDADASNTSDVLLQQCFSNGTCTFFATSDNDGNFELKIPLILGAQVFGYKVNGETSPISYFVGTTTTQGCPKSPVSVRLDYYSFDFGTQ